MKKAVYLEPRDWGTVLIALDYALSQVGTDTMRKDFCRLIATNELERVRRVIAAAAPEEVG
jgi:hypothetical protein